MDQYYLWIARASPHDKYRSRIRRQRNQCKHNHEMVLMQQYTKGTCLVLLGGVQISEILSTVVNVLPKDLVYG